MTDDSSLSWIGIWRSGPDAGASIPLAVGKHLLGRAHTAGVRCDDQLLQPHHALLEITADGRIWLTQLTGRVAIRVDGQPIDGVCELHADAIVEMGASMFVVTRARGAASPVHIHNGAVVRQPRSVSQWRTHDLAAPGVPPVRESGNGGLLPAAVGLAGAATIALVLRQPMFLLFGALGATVAIASWLTQRVGAVRRFRAATAEFEALRARHEADLVSERIARRQHLLATVATVERSLQALCAQESTLWSRRAQHHDAYLVAIGMDAAEHDLPVAVDIGPGCRLALLGPHSYNVARAIIVQLLASCGPADARIAVVTDHPDRWSAVRAFPHLTMADGAPAIVSEAELAHVLDELTHSTHRVWLTDQPALLATRTSPLRRATSDPRHDALIVVVPMVSDAAAPHVCTSVLTTTNGTTARWVSDVQHTLLPQHVRLVGVGERMAAHCAAAIKGLVDPEDSLTAAASMPRQLSLANLLHRRGTALTASSIAAAWSAAATDPPPRTAIGVAADGVVDIDLVRDGPHGLIAGTTGSGKSEFLRSLVAGMAATTSPTYLTFVLIDYKGGATFDACASLPHVVGMVTDLDDQLADRALRSLRAELQRRERILREHAAADLAELRAHAPSITLPRLVVVIDEFAALVTERPTFLHALVGIAQRGRSLGVHLLLATQRPGGVITDDIRANTNLRLALRVQDPTEAIDVVGVDSPAHLPRALPGRAVLRLGADEHLTFQTAQCTVPVPGSTDTELTVLVRAICDAAKLAGIQAPPAPWQPPLPEVLTRRDLGGTAGVGLVDEPDLQRTRPLLWSADEGHLAIVGSTGSGVTSALLTLADRVLSDARSIDVYVIDARGDSRWSQVALHPGCVATVRLHEAERRQRLIHRLGRQTCEHERGASRTLLIIDGLDALRRALDDVESAAEYAALEQVINGAAAAAITIVAGAESAAALPLSFLNACPARWVLHLNDAHDAALLGVAHSAVPARVPGRIAIAGSGAISQLVAPSPVSLAGPLAVGPPIEVVPTHLQASGLPRSRTTDDGSSLCLGVEFSSGEPYLMEIPEGEHVLVIGGARSGRSTALARYAAAWLDARPNAWVGAILPRRSTFPKRLARRVATVSAEVASLSDQFVRQPPDALLIVDDADLVEDAGGALAMIASRRSGHTVIAAGRPDALRHSYGHWTGALRRSRLGLIAAGGNDLDGDLLNTVIPRRTPVPPRPGLWWFADNGSVGLVQVAIDERVTPRELAGNVVAIAM